MTEMQIPENPNAHFDAADRRREEGDVIAKATRRAFSLVIYGGDPDGAFGDVRNLNHAVSNTGPGGSVYGGAPDEAYGDVE